MIYEIKLKEKGDFTSYCPRPLIPSDVRAYKVIIKTDRSLEGCSMLATAIRSDGQVITDIGEVYDGYAEYTLANNMYAVSGEMRLLLTINDYDGAGLTVKEIIFTVADETENEAIDGDDRLPVLNTLIDRCNNILNDCKSLGESYGGLVDSYVNLLNPELITVDNGFASIEIKGLEKGSAYCFNFQNWGGVQGITESGTYEVLSVEGTEYGRLIPAESMANYTGVKITWAWNRYKTGLMFLKGTEMPKYFKPYGFYNFINDELLQSVREDIPSNKIIDLTIDANAKTYPYANKICKMTIDKDFTFMLPNPVNDNFSQILIQANITQPVSIDWGTTHFFGKEVPTVEVGTYNFIFERDGANWYAGVIEKGVAE